MTLLSFTNPAKPWNRWPSVPGSSMELSGIPTMGKSLLSIAGYIEKCKIQSLPSRTKGFPFCQKAREGDPGQLCGSEVLCLTRRRLWSGVDKPEKKLDLPSINIIFGGGPKGCLVTLQFPSQNCTSSSQSVLHSSHYITLRKPSAAKHQFRIKSQSHCRCTYTSSSAGPLNNIPINEQSRTLQLILERKRHQDKNKRTKIRQCICVTSKLVNCGQREVWEIFALPEGNRATLSWPFKCQWGLRGESTVDIIWDRRKCSPTSGILQSWWYGSCRGVAVHGGVSGTFKLGGQRIAVTRQNWQKPVSHFSKSEWQEYYKQRTSYMGQPGPMNPRRFWVVSTHRGLSDLLLPQMTEGQIHAEKELSGLWGSVLWIFGWKKPLFKTKTYQRTFGSISKNNFTCPDFVIEGVGNLTSRQWRQNPCRRRSPRGRDLYTVDQSRVFTSTRVSPLHHPLMKKKSKETASTQS